MLLLVSATAFASSGKTYQLAELGMSIDIPTEYVVFTRYILETLSILLTMTIIYPLMAYVRAIYLV